MANKKQSTKYTGVRFREHPTRLHGIRKDRCFFVRYKVDSKLYEDSVGWASEGMTAEKASGIRAELRKAARLGEGSRTLNEKRSKEKKKQVKRDRENIIFSKFFTDTYYPQAELSKKPKTYKGEFQHVRDWINPVIGNKSIKDIDADDLNKIRIALSKAGRSKRTAQHVLSTVRIVWNHAKSRELVSGDCPVKSIKLGRIDNARIRFLKPEEIQNLLDEVASRDMKAHNLTVAAVNTGARLGELTALTWGNVNIEDRTLTFVHTKTGKPRTVPMTDGLFNVMTQIKQSGPGYLVFTNRKGEKWKEQPWAFRQAVKDLGFNEGRPDRKEHITFHSLRHTAASLMLASGVDVRTLQELFGWSTLQMLQRYTHATNKAKTRAVTNLGNILSNNSGKVISINKASNDFDY